MLERMSAADIVMTAEYQHQPTFSPAFIYRIFQKSQRSFNTTVVVKLISGTSNKKADMLQVSGNQ